MAFVRRSNLGQRGERCSARRPRSRWRASLGDAWRLIALQLPKHPWRQQRIFAPFDELFGANIASNALRADMPLGDSALIIGRPGTVIHERARDDTKRLSP